MKTVTRIAHYKFYSDPNKESIPSGLERYNEETGQLITVWPTESMLNKYRISSCTELKRVIIQTIPGLKIYIYKNSGDSDPLPYIIGATGVLDLEVSGPDDEFEMSGFTIDQNSKEILYNLKDSFFIITVIYESTEEEV